MVVTFCDTAERNLQIKLGDSVESSVLYMSLASSGAKLVKCTKSKHAVSKIFSDADTTAFAAGNHSYAGGVAHIHLRLFPCKYDTWQEIWKLFYNNTWFRSKLRFSVRKSARAAGLGADCYDDIQQEALVEFAKALQRSASLGFLSSKGTFRGFLSTVIYRCCLKGLRQFKRRHRPMSEDDFMHPYYEEHSQLEKLLDFRHLANQIPEPYRGIVRQLLTGETIDNIAQSRKRSKRTIYRWVDRSVELLKDRYFQG